jgi:hypothetical protein
MELKNALTVCLISLFSATLVMLVARTLDLQAAARLEPQMARIVEELEGLRKQGGIVSTASVDQSGPTLAEGTADALYVYYFHSKFRCPTCREIESLAHDFVQTELAGELNSGQVVWKVVNYEERANAELTKKFNIQMPVVVLAKMQGGQIAQWRSLDGVWGLVGDKAGYAAYLRKEVGQMVRPGQADAPQAALAEEATIPTMALEPPPLPMPTPTLADLPIPE